MTGLFRIAAGAVLALSVFVAASLPAAKAQEVAYKIGDRVAMPAGYGDKWLQAVVIAVDMSKPYPYRVHPLGYVDTMDSSFRAAMLRTPGAVKTEPPGGIANDPYLLAAQGRKAFKPTKLYTGTYECYAFSGGRLEPRPILNFTILDAERYRDGAGKTARYRFDSAAGTLVFEGGSYDGQRATYTQASDPPAKAQPPSIAFAVSGDACDRPI